ncbi:LytR/AlgR family response regulator transcription factor [Chitinophaga nivalis]|uniref:LytTR family DNA-binding domain-containing protein n=1 Tax=Chitinophaga nivalis TaxID=2991709 RepID=A0ABT3IS89_9BACT|nr:LytTR family DNA-binding domain-containing protein [Chitinophaga nivalis]MCW3463510.1 LytTR family DNA-binding domain-containing protein [Chitinophaga nivalis]MCW3486800.1 LytTR family DNA-binding domain-containing protein [Chitinophaga nivalis]
MLNCIIVEDEPLARRQLEAYIEQIPFLQLVGTARNPVIASAILQTEVVDLIFLDIKMPQMSGIEFLQQKDIFQQIIFITAYPEYALQGFELEVTDYLLKPVTFERFSKACEKAKIKISGSSTVKNNREQPDYLYVKCDNCLEKITLADILFIESMLNYVHIVTTKRKYTVYSSLKGIHERLPQNSFLKIHKSYIASLDHISTVTQSRVRIAGHELPISRRKQQDLKQYLTNKQQGDFKD